METVSPSRNRCYICGDSVELNHKYCSKCENGYKLIIGPIDNEKFNEILELIK